MNALIRDIAQQLDTGTVIPYLGPDMLSLCSDLKVPATPLALAEIMTSKVSVPHKIRKRLTQAAQFIENFKHRKSVVHLMNEAFAATPAPSALHLALAGSGAGLWVDTWYDDTMAAALAQTQQAATGRRSRACRSPSISATGPAPMPPTARRWPRCQPIPPACSTSPSAATARPATTWCPTATMSKC